jgi:hypothetical protein
MDTTARLTPALTDAIQVVLDDTDRGETVKTTQAAYLADRSGKETSNAFIAAIEARARITDPVKKILIEAWTDAISKASKEGLLKPLDQGPAATIFEDVWTPLLAEGWDALPDYRHEQFSEALAMTTNIAILRSSPDADAAELAAVTLRDIAAGNIPFGPGAGDYFKNFADGSGLHIEMTDWAPVLSNKGQTPKPTSKGRIYKAVFDTPSGRVLVADSVRVGPIPDLMSDLRSTAGLNINYDWHRILRTAICAHELNVIDVAMGDDGPGLVRAAASTSGADTVFAGFDDADWPEIANVCHDYWGTTMIDRDHVIAAMQNAAGTDFDPAAAKAEIDDWIAESPFHNEIEMAPGQWHFTWDDDRQTLQAALKAANIAAPSDTRFVLSRTPLDLGDAKVTDFGALMEVLSEKD